ncbi:uncharacterized protein LOC111359286 [Spodoptera litura]|uniref:Uncharacterized protein LOC111359286 n=1 Tax=Spodoptera litura TaxID=69820 RepID=A0A9J7EM59_SPOLT|nr:uncharacterized protein LOC111359286 [Spodoptera litura]
MSQVYSILSLFVLYSVRLIYAYPGDNVMLMPPFEMRAVDPYLTNPPVQYQPHFQASVPQQHGFNNVINHKRNSQIPMAETRSNQNLTFGEFMGALNEESRQSQLSMQELKGLRPPATAGRDDGSAYPTLPRPVGYRPEYAPPANYHEGASLVPHTPPSTAQPKTSLLNLSSVLSPASSNGNGSGNLSGLLNLVFSLFGGSSGWNMSGLQGGIVEGIIKPLMKAKGGIKALISKMSIPMISLMLINLEVLVTIWWLWEECPSPLPEPTPNFSKASSHSYNYNSYR